MYDIRDVIEKAIQIAEVKKGLYMSFVENTLDVRYVASIKTLINYCNKDINAYNKILDHITDELAGEIAFGTFDKISTLVTQFKRQMVAPKVSDRKAFLHFALDMEKAIYALLIDIQGRLVYDGNIQDSIPYWVISEMIEQKKTLINSLEAFCERL